MSQKPHHFRIGLFVLGGVVLVLAGLLAFGLRHSFEKRHGSSPTSRATSRGSSSARR